MSHSCVNVRDSFSSTNDTYFGKKYLSMRVCLMYDNNLSALQFCS